jgi:PAS domain S-box-containing protein/diguanylate cyclase (GGDEF)-like protein
MKISLARLSFYTTLITLASIFIVYVLLTSYEYNSYNEMKEKEMTQEYIQTNKLLLQKEVNAEISRINDVVDAFYSSLLMKLKNRATILDEIIVLHGKTLDTHMFHVLNLLSKKVDDGYNYIFDKNGEIIFHSRNASLISKNIFRGTFFPKRFQNFARKAIKEGEISGVYLVEEGKEKRKILTYVKKVEGFYLASSVFLDTFEKKLQENIFKILVSRKFGIDSNGYFWVMNTQNQMLLNPVQPNLKNKNLDNFKTKNGVYVFNDIQKSLSNKQEIYVQYDWLIPGQNEVGDKISFVKKVGHWGWILGAGFYFQSLNKSLANQKAKQQEFLYKLIGEISTVLIILFIIIIVISWYISMRFEEGENNQKRHLKLLEQYKSILDMVAIVSKTDLRGRITDVNPLFEKVSGYKKEEVLGKAHKIVRHPSTPREVFQDMWRAIQSGKVWRGILKNQSKDKKKSYINKTVITPIKNEKDEIIEYLSASIDISEVVEQRDAIQNLFLADALTGLGSRIKLLDEINKSKKSGYLCLIDIDRFTEVNDMYGNRKGDSVLKDVAKDLSELCEEKDRFVYRIHADVFAIYVIHISREEFETYIYDLLEKLSSKTYTIIKDKISLNYTAGIAYGDCELMACADMALKIAKKTKKSVVVYDKNNSMISEFEENHQWMQKLSKAVDEGRIIPYYQPIYEYKSEKIIKYEVLMRYIDKDGSAISPFKFIDIAKKTRLYPKLTIAIVEQAVSFFNDHRDKSFSINLTLEDLLNQESMNYIFSILKQHDLFKNIVFEIVESEELEGFEEVEKILQKFKNEGVKIAIDDFGTGYSNYGYLLKLDVEYIKIDGSIIKNLQEQTSARELVASVVQFAKRSGIQTIAEFVSSKELDAITRELGVDFAQGYYYGKPEEGL